MEYDVVTKVGSNLSKEEIAACVKVIREGCAVDSQTAALELPYAVAVAIVRAVEDIVGVGRTATYPSSFICGSNANPLLFRRCQGRSESIPPRRRKRGPLLSFRGRFPLTLGAAGV